MRASLWRAMNYVEDEMMRAAMPRTSAADPKVIVASVKVARPEKPSARLTVTLAEAVAK